MLEEVSDSVLSVHRILDLLAILTLILTTTLRDSCVAAILIKTSHIVLALLALCKNELDMLAQVEIVIFAL